MKRSLAALLIIVSTSLSAIAQLSGILSLIPNASGATVPSPTAPGRSIGVGDNAWERTTLPLPALDGGQYSLDRWRGKVILLNFWASWCAPCQYEIPELVSLQEKYGQQGLQVIGIGVDDARPLRNVHRSLGINYPVLVAEGAHGAEFLKHWGNDSQIVPYNVVIGRDGRINYAQLGQFDQELFVEYVYPLFSQPQHTE